MKRDESLDHPHMLMMAELDDELGPAEIEELDALCRADSRLADERRRLAHVKEATRMTRIPTPPDAAWEGYWRSTYRRIELTTGWVLVSIGALLLGGWGTWTAVQAMLADPAVPALVKWGLFALLFGGVILTVSVVREKIFTAKNDPFEEIVR